MSIAVREPVVMSRLRSRIRSVARANVLTKGAVFTTQRLLSLFRPGNVVMFHLGRVGSTVLWSGEIFERTIRKWEMRG